MPFTVIRFFVAVGGEVMDKKSVVKLFKIIGGILLAIFFAAAAALLCMDVVESFAEDDLKEASWCTFVIPSGFVPGPESGVFINKNHPMESSTIKYSFYDNGKDVVLTNRERAAESINIPQSMVTDEPTLLTKEIYQETISAAYNSKYGQDVGFNVESFESISVDGYPGFKIESSYRAQDEETIHQTVYMLISKYKVFTVTYQRAEDDDCSEQFEKSAATIHVN